MPDIDWYKHRAADSYKKWPLVGLRALCRHYMASKHAVEGGSTVDYILPPNPRRPFWVRLGDAIRVLQDRAVAVRWHDQKRS